MPSVAAAFAAAATEQRDLATRAQLLAAGLGRTRLSRAVAAGELVRVHPGVYGRTALEPPAEHLLSSNGADPRYLRMVQAALLALGPDAVACGRTAAVVWGLDLLVEPTSVEVTVGRNRSRIVLESVTASRRSAAMASELVQGIRVTPVPLTLRRVARTRPLGEAVALLDAALRRELIELPRLVATVGRGSSLERAVRLADPRSGSVLESALRVLFAQHGLVPLESQYVVRGGGRFLARVDFCWPGLRLIVEADGRRWHDPEDARKADRRRANACAAYGWRILRFTWAEVLHEPAYVVASVQQALRAAA